jgi:hypothetical protein
MREGSVVRIDVVTAGRAGRVGVVVGLPRIHGTEGALVAWATPTLHPELVRMEVHPADPAGPALGFEVPVYFYQRSTWIGAVGMVTVRGAVPPYLVAALRALLTIR